MLSPLQFGQVAFTPGQEIGADGQNSQTNICRDHQLDADIVIKKIRKGSMTSYDEFFSESRLLYMSSHPNVCQVHYACHDTDHIYIAMPLYQRGSLKTWMSRERLTVREIIVAGCQILSGLSNIHSKGLIHFDIKPDNILLSDRGEAIVADFGQEKQIDITGYAVQNRLYNKNLAPEVLSGNAADKRYDIYQFGLLLYRLCNGNDDFNDQITSIINSSPRDPSAFRQAILDGRFPVRDHFLPHIPVPLRRVISKCLAVNPDERFQSAISVSNDLATIGSNHLDWRYRSEPDRQVWEKNESGTSIELVRNTDQTCVCYKTSGSGSRRRYGKGCFDRATDTKIKTFLGNE